jgi:hypothetical protein
MPLLLPPLWWRKAALVSATEVPNLLATATRYSNWHELCHRLCVSVAAVPIRGEMVEFNCMGTLLGELPNKNSENGHST